MEKFNEVRLSADFLVIGGGIAGLTAAVAAKEKNPDEIIVFMHYPPIIPECLESEFSRLLKEYGVSALPMSMRVNLNMGIAFALGSKNTKALSARSSITILFSLNSG